MPVFHFHYDNVTKVQRADCLNSAHSTNKIFTGSCGKWKDLFKLNVVDKLFVKYSDKFANIFLPNHIERELDPAGVMLYKE